MQKIIEKLREDIDADIVDFLLDESDQKRDFLSNLKDDVHFGFYRNWELMSDPLRFVMDWQNIRSLRNKNK